MDISEARKKLLENPEFKERYYKKDLAFEISKMIIDARIIKNMSQARLAELIGTKQPGITRIERGNRLPSLRLLQKIAEAFDTYLLPPKFAFLKGQDLAEGSVKNINLESKGANARIIFTTQIGNKIESFYNYNGW